MQQFEALQVPVLMVGAASFNDVETGMRLVGQALGLSGNAEQAINKLEKTATPSSLRCRSRSRLLS